MFAGRNIQHLSLLFNTKITTQTSTHRNMLAPFSAQISPLLNWRLSKRPSLFQLSCISGCWSLGSDSRSYRRDRKVSRQESTTETTKKQTPQKQRINSQKKNIFNIPVRALNPGHRIVIYNSAKFLYSKYCLPYPQLPLVPHK